MADRYGGDVLSGAAAARGPLVPDVPAVPGLVVECATTGWCGAVVGFDKGSTGWAVVLEDRRGSRRPFVLEPAAFLLDGEPVTLVRPALEASGGQERRTASGSVAGPDARARVARSSRIWVEGSHDAELVERVWGDDLRVEGVVVEHLGGIDELVERLQSFDPGVGRRVGVLVDHLVPGSKESRIADEAVAGFGPDVLVLGHPYVDIWQAVRPAAVGITRWPDVPRGQDWKRGVCRRLGWADDPSAAWRRILGSVATYTDLETPLLASMEELIDFVTALE